MDGNGQTTISYIIKIWNHPIEISMYKPKCFSFQIYRKYDQLRFSRSLCTTNAHGISLCHDISRGPFFRYGAAGRQRSQPNTLGSQPPTTRFSLDDDKPLPLENRCFLKWWYPKIIHFNRVFHYKPYILEYHYFCKPTYKQKKSWPNLVFHGKK